MAGGTNGEESASELPETFVNAQVLIPTLNGAGELSSEMLDLLNDIKEARNTSCGSIDALQIITLIMVYYPSFVAAAEGEPSNALWTQREMP